MNCKKCGIPTANGADLCPRCLEAKKKRIRNLLWIIPGLLAVVAVVLTTLLIVHSLKKNDDTVQVTDAPAEQGKISVDGYLDYMLTGEVKAPSSAYEALAPKKKQTFLMYLVGSDLESNSASATNDLLELINANVDISNSNFIIFTGGSTYWHLDIPADKNSILCLKEDGSLVRIQEKSLSNMGVASTLTFFLEYTYYSFPADEYNLILWNHGGGSIEGFGIDTVSDDKLLLPEIKSALEASPFTGDNKLNWVAFDACLMATIETADVFSEHADYLIASEEVTSACGFNYGVFSELSRNVYSGPEAAEIIGQGAIDYLYAQNSYSLEYMADNTPFSCLDLSKVDEVESAMNSLFSKMDTNISSDFSRIMRVRSNIYTYGTYASSGNDSLDLIDLYEFAEGVAPYYPAEAQALMNAINSLVAMNIDPTGYSNGVSVYFPLNCYYYDPYYLDDCIELYATYDFAEGYTRYITNFVAVLNGESPVVWEGSQDQIEEPTPNPNPNPTPTPEPDTGNLVSQITLNLNDNQLSNFLKAERYIYAKNYQGGYYIISKTSDVTLNGNTLNTVYDPNVYRISDGHNLAELSLIEYRRNGNEILYTSPAVIARSGARSVYSVCNEGIFVELLIVFNESYPNGKIMGYYRSVDNNYDNLYQLTDGMTIVTISYGIMEKEYDQYGNLKPIDECDGLTVFYSDTVIEVNNNLSVVRGEHTDDNAIYMSVVIHDTHGYAFSTSYRKTKEKS